MPSGGAIILAPFFAVLFNLLYIGSSENTRFAGKNFLRRRRAKAGFRPRQAGKAGRKFARETAANSRGFPRVSGMKKRRFQVRILPPFPGGSDAVSGQISIGFLHYYI